MAKKEKVKKPNPKREKYSKFRREKPDLKFDMPDLTPEQQRNKKYAEKTIIRFFSSIRKKKKKKK